MTVHSHCIKERQHDRLQRELEKQRYHPERALYPRRLTSVSTPRAMNHAIHVAVVLCCSPMPTTRYRRINVATHPMSNVAAIPIRRPKQPIAHLRRKNTSEGKQILGGSSSRVKTNVKIKPKTMTARHVGTLHLDRGEKGWYGRRA